MSTLQKSNQSGVLILALIAIAPAMWLGSVCWKAHQAALFLNQFQTIHESKPPLTLAQVETLMGHPQRVEHSESTGLVGDVYHYSTYPRGGDFSVIFVNGVVFGTAIPPYKS